MKIVIKRAMSGKAHGSLYKGNDFIGKYYYEIPKIKYKSINWYRIWILFKRRNGGICKRL